MYNINSSVKTLITDLNAFLDFKDIGGINGLVYFFIVFNLVLSKLQDAFYRILKFKILFKV